MNVRISTTSTEAEITFRMPLNRHPYLSVLPVRGAVTASSFNGPISDLVGVHDLPDDSGVHLRADLTWYGQGEGVTVPPPARNRLWLQPNVEGGSGGQAPTYPYQHAYCSGNWFSDAAMTTLYSRAQLKPGAELLPRNAFVIVDIEHWDLSDPVQAEKVRRLAGDYKALRPDVEIGLYGEVPNRDFWTPAHRFVGLKALEEYKAGRGENAHAIAGVATRDAEGKWQLDPATEWNVAYTNWQKSNDLKAGLLLPAFDVVCPSVYIFYPFDGDAAATQYTVAYLKENIEEAIRVSGGRPVRAFVTPHLQAPEDKRLMTEFEWRTVCRTLAAYPQVDIVVWYPLLPQQQRFIDVVNEALSARPYLEAAK